MNSKNILVSFVALVAMLIVVTSVSAAEITNNAPTVYVKGVAVNPATDVISVVEGETLSVRVVFNSNITASDVKVKAEIEGYDTTVEDITARFDVEKGMQYNKVLTLKIPADLKDDLSDSAVIQMKIYNKNDATNIQDIKLRIQRDSYTVGIVSLSVDSTAEAGSLYPVDVVLKNKGYNDLTDLYVTAKIKELGIEKQVYFGDLVAIEQSTDNEDEVDTVSGRIYLQIPDNAKAGPYTLEVIAESDDTTSTEAKQIVIQNGLTTDNVLVTVSERTVATGQDAEYNILIVNPSNKLKVYKIVPEVTNDLTVEATESIVAVNAGSSKTVTVKANAQKEGAYAFNVNVFSNEELVQKVALKTNVEGKNLTANPILVLTIVLAIVFLVLLVVLFVLIGKKPSKSEDFGESYY